MMHGEERFHSESCLHYDMFFMLSIAALALNLVSQTAAMPIQFLLIAYAAFRADVRYLPSLYVLILNKSNFTAFHTPAVKLYIGFSVSPENFFVLSAFFISLVALLRNRYERKQMAMAFLMLLSFIPALVIAVLARKDGVSGDWQDPITKALVPSLFYWGVLAGRRWQVGKEYFIKRMFLVMLGVNLLEALNQFYIFTFVEWPLAICLSFAVLFLLKRCVSLKLLVLPCVLLALFNMLFSRYFTVLYEVGYASNSELSTTFTRTLIVIVTVGLAVYGLRRFAKASVVRWLPDIALIFCCSVFAYSVGRASSVSGPGVEKDYRSLLERFEFKLVGDRGAVWSTGMAELTEEPLVFKRISKFIEYRSTPDGRSRMTIRLLPHNQVLSLIGRSGWWLGGMAVLFLWYMMKSSFNRLSCEGFNDQIMWVAMASPFFATFFVLGLTGQTVFSARYCENALVTMIFPGIICGALPWRTLKRS